MTLRPARGTLRRTRAILILAPTLLAGTACSDRKTAEAPAPALPPEVGVTKAQSRTIPIEMEFPGTVQSIRAVKIIPQVSGPVLQRTFKEGTRVQQSDPLYVIDPRPFQAQLDAATAQLQEDLASLQYWKVQAERNAKLYAKGDISQENKQKADAQLAQIQAAVAKDQADIAEARLNVDYSVVKAPFPGYIEETLVHEGSQVVAGQTSMTTLVQTDPVHVVFSISRAQLASMQRLQAQGYAPAEFSDFPARVRLGDGSFFPHEGRVDFVSSQVDLQTDTAAARAEIPNPSDGSGNVNLISGQYVPILITVGQRPEAILVPKAALVETQAGQQIYLVGDNHKVERRVVEIGPAFEGDWVVSKGIEAGDKVIVSGLQKIKTGVEVTIAPTKKEASHANRQAPVEK
ncbi:MAG: efflux RND transporter periplasmic adaptor subunit [Chromatiaceae bacterium]|nr:efflux RND transporter periplasmic adaptor subunit [Chromatiaceae bacterium]